MRYFASVCFFVLLTFISGCLLVEEVPGSNREEYDWDEGHSESSGMNDDEEPGSDDHGGNSPSSKKSSSKTGKVIKSEYPFVVFIELSEIHLCFGSLVSKKFVVTLSSCLRYHEELNKLQIRVQNSSGNRHFVIAIHHHPKFAINGKDDNYVNDIALIELETDIKKVKPAQLFEEAEKVDPGAKALVIGMGSETVGDVELRRFNVKVVARSACEKWYEGSSLSWDQICAGEKNTFAQSCMLNRGAPLVVRGKLAGIFDTTSECEKSAGKPMLYTWLAAHREWIDSLVPGLKAVNEVEQDSSWWIYAITFLVLSVALAGGIYYGLKYRNRW